MTNVAPNKTALEILKEARELIATTGWYQGGCAGNETGEVVSYDDRHATCFCVMGAIWNKGGFISRGSIDAEWAFKAATGYKGLLGEMSVGKWNDAPGRTVEEVLATFDGAIAAEEAKLAA